MEPGRGSKLTIVQIGTGVISLSVLGSPRVPLSCLGQGCSSLGHCLPFYSIQNFS